MKKLLALLLAFVLVFSFASCGKKANEEGEKAATAESAHTYLSTFFRDYNKMNDFFAKCKFSAPSDIPVSEILLGYYHSRHVSFSFSYPEKSEDNVYTSTVVVKSPNFRPVYKHYKDDLAADPNLDKAQSVLNHLPISPTEADMVEKTVSVTLRYTDGKWALDSNPDLAVAIIPNIDSLG